MRLFFRETVPKGLEDSARGFNPGCISKSMTRPEKAQDHAVPNSFRYLPRSTNSTAPFLLRPTFPELRRTGSIPTRYAGAIRTWCSTPSLRMPGFEDEDENEAFLRLKDF